MKKNHILALRYARAFLASQQNKPLPKSFVVSLDAVIAFFVEHPLIITCFTIQGLSINYKKQILIDKVFTPRCDHVQLWLPLIELVARSNRLTMCPAILEAIRDLYAENTKQVFGELLMYPELSAENQDVLKTFFKQKTGYTLTSAFKTDASLIAGVRMRGGFFVWEDSIRKRVQTVRQFMYR